MLGLSWCCTALIVLAIFLAGYCLIDIALKKIKKIELRPGRKR